MKPAAWPREDPRTTRLLHLDPRRQRCSDRRIGELAALLRPGDLLVVNDAATLPASLRGVTADGAPVEVRLAGETGAAGAAGEGGETGETGAAGGGLWSAVLLGAGDWRSRTEDRPPPPAVRAGDTLRLGRLQARVAGVDPASPRLVSLRFALGGAALWQALYHAGKPVQYAHTFRPLALWQVQTAYAARPWAAEAPSAGFALTWDLLLGLRRRGVAITRVTHAAGLSSTGDARLDARLPFAERYEVSVEAVQAVDLARRRGGRIVAVGTTVARALEGAAAAGGGRLGAGQGTTELRLGPELRPRVVGGILTGMHEPGTSHYALLESFAPRQLLDRARSLAARRGYRSHEFGDALLILPEVGTLSPPETLPGGERGGRLRMGDGSATGTGSSRRPNCA